MLVRLAESRPENDRDEKIGCEKRHDALTPVLDPGLLPRTGMRGSPAVQPRG